MKECRSCVDCFHIHICRGQDATYEYAQKIRFFTGLEFPELRRSLDEWCAGHCKFALHKDAVPGVEPPSIADDGGAIATKRRRGKKDGGIGE